MTNTQTQCPSCQSTYPVPDAQLNNATAKARCPECQTIFLVNDNRYDPMSSKPVTVKSEPVSSQSSQGMDDILSSLNTDFMSDEPISPSPTQPPMSNTSQSPQETDDILGSLDDMSQFMNQQFESSSVNNQTEKPVKNSTQPSTQSQTTTVDSIEDDDLFETSQEPSTTNLSLNGNDEFSEDLITATKQDSLSDLMNTYGVTADDNEADNNNKDDRIAKMRNRVLKNGQTSQQASQNKSPVATLLWSLGCVLLVLLFLVQYVIFNINTLVKSPSYSSKLATVCNILSCNIPNADINSLKVTQVQYRPSQVKSASSYTDIVAAIENRSNKSQLSPNLKVSIQGSNGLIGEFIAEPKDYMVVSQEKISEGQYKPFMFTIGNKSGDITNINVEAFY